MQIQIMMQTRMRTKRNMRTTTKTRTTPPYKDKDTGEDEDNTDAPHINNPETTSNNQNKATHKSTRRHTIKEGG